MSTESYITVKGSSYFEYEDRKSVFIGMAMPVSCEADAIAFIESVKKRYPDARHHVYAYVLRENSTMRFTDDREPQGTAGMPVLDIIRKNGCTDVCIVVTRYFGGTLLGTGGLVRAYTSAALGAEQAIEEKRLDADTDYTSIKGLRIEAAQKLNKLRPLNIGQASRISGVNPADVSVLLIWLKSKED